MQNPKNFMGETNNCKVYGFCACIGCDLKVSRPIMCHFSDTGKNHKDYSQKISSVALLGQNSIVWRLHDVIMTSSLLHVAPSLVFVSALPERAYFEA